MSMLAPTLQAFFTDRLTRQRNASPHTIAAYRDTLRLLLAFAHQQTGKQPCQLDLDDLDAPLVGAFLDHLEHERHNSIRTRNARLAAIRPGSKSAPDTRTTPRSRPAPAERSAETLCNDDSPNTQPPPRSRARRWRPRRSALTSSGTPPRCGCCTPGSTRP
jgi:hypothetical protein